MWLSPLRDPTRVSPLVRPLLEEMLQEARPAYREMAQRAVEALGTGRLVGLYSALDSFWVRLRVWGARPVNPASGALFQVHPRRNPPSGEEDLPGWVIVQDGFQGGLLVLVHELSHFVNRWPVWQLASEEPSLVAPELARGYSREQLAWTRATFVNEVAARHTAFLAHSGASPGERPLPPRGALFGCAVTISRYPEVYHDCGYLQRLLELQDTPRLRDQVGQWLQGLERFAFFAPGSARATAHASFLREEVQEAARGRHAPVVVGDGTL